MNLDNVKGLVIGFVLISLIASAGAIALDAFQDSDSVETNSYAYNISGNGLLGIDNTTSYFGTAGTIAGVSLLLGIIFAAFYMWRK